MAGRRPARAGTRARKAAPRKTDPRRSAARPGKQPRARKAPRGQLRRASSRAGAAPARKSAAAAGRLTAPDRVPSGIGVVSHHMDYSSHDVEQVKRFYTETLGFTNFNFDTRYSYLWIQTGPRSSLGFMPPMPGPPEQWRPPREPSIYLIVEDVDHAHRLLTAKGVAFEQAPADMPWGHRTAVLRDPEGRLLCLAQPLER